MKITGIICEYNPFHKGHQKQFSIIRSQEPDCGIVCLMSGNYVQRGMPAVYDKSCRAKAAVLSGADLVLELPVTAALSSAEGFAAEGVRILGSFCDQLSFGAEDAEPDTLLQTAQALLSEDFRKELKEQISVGMSFPAARQAALEKIGLDGSILTKPNNILAIEYYKAILSQNSQLKPMPITRRSNYHDTVPNAENPSASSLRNLIENGESFTDYIPSAAADCFKHANVHTLQAGEKAILYRLRAMTDAEFEQLPFGSEGLWRKLMKNARQCATLEEILTNTKSKRYTRTRLDRMVICAYLGLSAQDIDTSAPYVRVLALNDKGREILLKARKSGWFANIGERIDDPYQAIEKRCDDLYGLFTGSTIETSGIANDRRVFYHNRNL